MRSGLSEEPPFESSTIIRVDGDLVVTTSFSKLGKKPCHHGFKPFVSSSPSCFSYGCSNPCSNLPIKKKPSHLLWSSISEVPIDDLQTAEGTIGSCDVCWENPEVGSIGLAGAKSDFLQGNPGNFPSDFLRPFQSREGEFPQNMVVIFRIWESETPKWPKQSLQKECNKGNKGFFSRTILAFKDELLCLVKKGKSESWRTFLWKWNLRQNVSATVIPLN